VPIANVCPLAQVREAYTELERRQTRGKIVLTPWRLGNDRPSITRSQRIPRDCDRQEFGMSETLDWNTKTIAEFRANDGRVGGNFEGAPMVLVHHRGRSPYP
jgi:hypothetical protein